MGGSNSAEAPKEDEDPPVNVDTGDSVKVKQTLDEAVVKAVLDHGYEEHHTLDNAKLLLMLVACSFAMVAQFWPIPFPASRPLLGVCCSMYFVLSGILQLVVWFVERDAIMFTAHPMPTLAPGGADGGGGGGAGGGAPPAPPKRAPGDARAIGLRIRSSFPRFQEFYTLTVQLNKPEGTTPTTTEVWSVGQFFDAEGVFWEAGFCDAVEKLLATFEAKKFD